MANTQKDKLIAERNNLAAWILADGRKFIADEGVGCYEDEEGFDELWNSIVEEMDPEELAEWVDGDIFPKN